MAKPLDVLVKERYDGANKQWQKMSKTGPGKMLLTVTSNPTIDRTLYVPELVIGAVHRTTAVHMAAGGKGLNVTRAARTLGGEVLATAALAGRAGQIVAELAQAEGLAANWYWLSGGETRTCLLINHNGGDATVINEQGPAVTAADWQAFAVHIKALAQQAAVVAFSGSVPPGVHPAALGEAARDVAALGTAVYVDTSGPALAALLEQPEGICLKVNQLELAAGLGLAARAMPFEALIEAGQQVLARGAAQVIITLGGKGALALAPDGGWRAIAPPIDVVSTVGSGDSLLAGLSVAQLRGKSLDNALAFGVACGSANALSDLPGRFRLDQVESFLSQIEVIKL